MARIVLAYSGGLDTSAAIPWLAEKYKAEIVAVTVDLGQGVALEGVRDRALAIGCARAHVIDARETFARDFILPALQAGALDNDRHPLATALGRPLLAKHLVEIAKIEGATAVAHGCGTDEDQSRMESAIRALDSSIRILAPARAWGMPRAEVIEYARARGIPVPAGADGAYAADVNLWGRTVTSSGADDLAEETPEDAYLMTKAPADCPDVAASVDLEFAAGVPVKLNDVPMPVVELIATLNTIAGAHGVGRADRIDNRQPAHASREISEAPAAVVLHAAHRELQQVSTPRDLDRLSLELGGAYADLIMLGRWYSPTREAIDAFVRKVQDGVSGVIRMKFFKGDCRVTGRTTKATTKGKKTKAGVQ